MIYILLGVIVIIFILFCLSSSIGVYMFYNRDKSTSTTPDSTPKPIEVTLDKDPKLIYNYTISNNTRVLMSGKISSDTFINNINMGLTASGISTLVAKIVPSFNKEVIVKEYYKIVVDNNTYYLTTDSEDMLYILMLILPDYTAVVNTVINTKETSNITITPGMKNVSLSKLSVLAI